MKIREIFDQLPLYFKNIEELDQCLKGEKNYEEWLASMKNRAKLLQESYRRANDAIQALNQYEATPFENEEEAFEVYELVKDAYHNRLDDPEFLMPVVRKLITFFEVKKDYDKLIHLYYIGLYEVNEMDCRPSASKADLSYQMKILDLKKYYPILNEAGRVDIFSTYYHLSSVCLGMQSLTPMEAYYWYKEAMEFYYSDVVHPIDKDNPRILEAYNQIRYDWVGEAMDWDDLSEEARLDLHELVTELFEEEIEQGSIYNVESYVYSSYLELERKEGKKTLQEVISEYMDFYRYQIENRNPEVDDLEYFYTIIECPNTIEHWVRFLEDKELQRNIIHELNEVILSRWEEFKDSVPAPFMQQLLAEWCCLSIRYFDTRKEKEQSLFHLIIAHQIPTYLHSVMVKNLVLELFKESYKVKPELYDSLGMTDEELLELVQNSALIHDIGKTKITEVINRQGRRLSNLEFGGIRRHPELGVEFIKDNPDLEIYKDVILYHHKFYNGDGGYPFGSDNVKSKYRIIIDLVTICDCVDAATDSLGRNYKFAKTMEMVLAELQMEAGVRYNPDLVHILLNSDRLIEKFKQITEYDRPKLMYEAYMETKER